MAANNNCTFVGRLTADPAVQTTSNGTNYCRFTVAVDKNGKVKEGEPAANFIACVVWRDYAVTFANNNRKGSLIAVTGELEDLRFTNSKGETVNSKELKVENIKFLTPKTARQAQAAPAEQASGRNRSGSYQATNNPYAGLSVDDFGLDDVDL